MTEQQSSNAISVLYKARVNLLNILEQQNYNISDYNQFSINEMHIMYNNNKQSQLDMLLTSNEDIDNSVNDKKVYVKYHLEKTITRDNINDYIDDLFNLEQVLSKKDTLIILMKKDPNDTLISILNQVWVQEGIFIIIFNLDRLQFNILEHKYVPKHKVLTIEEVEDMKKRYNVVNDSDLPGISRYDPVAQAIGMRPGEICKITRNSKTAITSEYFRLCK
tara:strand:+ start:501 stop:1160 length:660 start_codon:yes stop_codon:yes gene_type:complete